MGSQKCAHCSSCQLPSAVPSLVFSHWQTSCSGPDARGEAHPLTIIPELPGAWLSWFTLCPQSVAQGPELTWFSMKLHDQVLQ